MNYVYNIQKILSKDLNNIKIKKNDKIFFCVYEILFKINSTEENPFLQFLMYKYGKKDNMNENLTLPFILYKSGNVLNISKRYLNNILSYVPEYKGYLYFEGQLHLFFGKENKGYIFEKFTSNNKHWWCLIDEICNKKKILNYHIHDSVSKLFLSNPEIIYLYDKRGHNYEIPIIGYKGDHYDVLPYIAAFGQRRSTRSRFGPFYTFGTYNWAIRYAGWSRNYQKHIFQNKEISDDNGKYKRCGLIRFALFLDDLEKSHVIMKTSDEYFLSMLLHYDDKGNKSRKDLEKWSEFMKKNAGKWSTKYSSLTIPVIKFKQNSGYFNTNTEYILSDHKKKIPLSIHEIDVNSLKSVWDPFYENYQIL